MEPQSPVSSDEREALDEIANQHSEEQYEAVRLHQRVTLKLKIKAMPGNASDADKGHLVGVSGDLSQGGCRVMFKRPLLVGDVYRLEFEKSEYELPSIYARCLRCRLVHETAFEVGFAFFTPVNLRGASKASGDLLG